jgi:hypothetical protein
VAYLHYNRVGCSVHIRCSETEQTKGCANQAVLPAVVVDHTIPMVAAVIFDGQPLEPIEQVRTTQEVASIVMDGNLNLRLREPRKHEEHS